MKNFMKLSGIITTMLIISFLLIACETEKEKGTCKITVTNSSSQTINVMIRFSCIQQVDSAITKLTSGQSMSFESFEGLLTDVGAYYVYIGPGTGTTVIMSPANTSSYSPGQNKSITITNANITW